MDAFDLGGDPALARLARIVHAADVAGELDRDPLGPGLLAIGEGGLEVEADDQRLLERGRFVYDALYAWCQQQRWGPVHLELPELSSLRPVPLAMTLAALVLVFRLRWSVPRTMLVCAGLGLAAAVAGLPVF